ncbi:cytochrome b/b6 domain-containing protein [Pseudodesulfovibrio hydrargyri]|nr:cytochrome b/b6 domain-containing protein [Pseudodesulfovibrio hydrargyri]
MALMVCTAPLRSAWADTGGGDPAPVSVRGSAPQSADGASADTPAAPAPARFPDGVRRDTCLGCHGKADLRAVTERGAGLDIHIPENGYDRSVHGRMECVVCHAPKAAPEDFGKIPHNVNREALPSCMNCHDKAFDHVRRQIAKSRHFEKQGSKITCTDCHNPHTQRRVTAMDSYSASVADSNRPCVDCHTSAIHYKELTGKAVYTQDLSHEFLPFRDRHFASVRCVECHTPADGDAQVHEIQAKEKALRDCTACHNKDDSLLVSRIAGYTDSRNGGGAFLGKGFFDDAELIAKMQKANIAPGTTGAIVNRIVPEGEIIGSFGDAYVPGLGQTSALDGRANLFLLAVLAALVLHGLLRVFTGRGAAERDVPGERIYSLWVRILHWINALLFLVLFATGLSIHFPGGWLSLPMEFSVDVHDVAGGLLTANFAVFLLYSLLSGDIVQYIPFKRGTGRRFWRQIHYYLIGIFRGDDKPHHVSASQRMNPVQQLTYLLVYCLGMFVMLGSGLLLLVPELAARVVPWATPRGLATAHYVLAACYLAFLLLHVYMTTTGKRAFSLIKAMITGRHFG